VDLDSSSLGEGPVAGSCEHGKELSGSIKGGELFEYLSDYQHLKKDFTPWSDKKKHFLIKECKLF
jgi:hypothetical protein